MIPLDVALDPQAPDVSADSLRGKLHAAQAVLRRVEALEREAAALPLETTPSGTVRLLTEQRRLALDAIERALEAR